MRRIFSVIFISCILLCNSYCHSLTDIVVKHEKSGGSDKPYQPCLLCYETPGTDYVEIKISPSHFPFLVSDASVNNSSKTGMNMYFIGFSGLPVQKSSNYIISILHHGTEHPVQMINQNSPLLENGKLTIQIQYKARYCINPMNYSHNGTPFSIVANVEIENFSPTNGNSLGIISLQKTEKTGKLYNCNGTLPYELMMTPFSFNKKKKHHLGNSKFNFYVYPNPTRGDILIDFKIQEEKDIKVSLINSIGQIIVSSDEATYLSQGSNDKIKLDLSYHPPGIYYLYLRVDGNTLVKKIIRN